MAGVVGWGWIGYDGVRCGLIWCDMIKRGQDGVWWSGMGWDRMRIRYGGMYFVSF